MSPATPTHPPNDRHVWRRLVARTHPDAGGDHELFIWAMATRDVVCGGELGEEIPRRRPAPQTYDAPDRIPFTPDVDYVVLKNYAIDVAEEVEEPYKTLLFALLDCGEAYDGPLLRMQRQGATYKSLAAIAYKALMTKEQRVRWYRIAESVPLSQRFAGHIIATLQKKAA